MRGGNLSSLAVATFCGVASAYVTLAPALAERRAAMLGEAHEKEGDGGGGDGDGDENGNGRQREKDTQLSRAILSDLKEAKEQVVGKQELGKEGMGGFAWGIREWVWGSRQTTTNEKGEEKVERKDEERGK
ncbi:hypothetical protein BST61_g4420 [Cercospora zeina]